MGNVKKLNEVKVGDTLYCLSYGMNAGVSIVELTVKELVNDGPHCERHIYSREAIIIKEKVPNSPEPEGEYCIDQYYRGDECLTHSNDIYTTFLEAVEAANKELRGRFMYYSEEEKKCREKKWSAFQSMFELSAKLSEYAAKMNIKTETV